MAEHETCAAFYLPAAEAEPGIWAADLVGKVGRVWRDFAGDLNAEWGGVICEVEVFDVAEHRVLALVFSYRGFTSLVQADGDGGAALAAAFQDACEAWQPTVAMLSSQQVEDVAEFVRKHLDDVRAGNVFNLAQEGFGLLYARQPPPHLDGLLQAQRRDELPVSRGRLFFAGAGADRWWG